MADIRVSQLPSQAVGNNNFLIGTTGSVTFKVLTSNANTASSVVIRDAYGNSGFNAVNCNNVNAGRGDFTDTVKAAYFEGDGSKLTNLPITDGVPVGTIILFGSIFPPNGYITCDGRAISRSTYNTLYQAIGTNFGRGDGTSTFNLPDLRGRVPMGVGVGPGLSNRVIATNLGAETHLLTANESGIRAHSHHQTYGGCFRSAGGCESSNRSAQGNGGTQGGLITANNAASNALATHNNIQPSLVLAYFIKAV